MKRKKKYNEFARANTKIKTALQNHPLNYDGLAILLGTMGRTTVDKETVKLILLRLSMLDTFVRK